MLGCLISFRMSISLVTRSTSASSTIFLFSRILTATYSNVNLKQLKVKMTYFFACENMSAQFHFTEGALADIFTDDVVSNASRFAPWCCSLDTRHSCCILRRRCFIYLVSRFLSFCRITSLMTWALFNLLIRLGFWVIIWIVYRSFTLVDWLIVLEVAGTSSS